MNLQALAAMDDCEHATGKTLEGHIRGQRTPKEVIAGSIGSISLGAGLQRVYLDEAAHYIIHDLRAAGYQIVQVVQTGNKPFP